MRRSERVAWVLAAALVAASAAGLRADERARYEVLGIGGAGGMFTPSASQHDSGLMFVSCDMSGAYRSLDGGRRWELIHWRQMSRALRCMPCFAPDGVYWASGNGLRRSRDRGATWQPLTEVAPPWQAVPVTRIVAAPGDGGQETVLLVGTDLGVWVSRDGGGAWTQARRGRCRALLGLGRNVYASVDRAFLASADAGATWEAIPVPEIENRGFQGLAGGSDGGATALYGLVFGSGVIKSTDGGRTWRTADRFRDCSEIVMASNQVDVVYTAQGGRRGTPESGFGQVFRTLNGGVSWEPCFFMGGNSPNVERSWVQTELRWGYSIMDLGLGVNPADARMVMLTTQGDFYVTRDGGERWQQVMNEAVGVTEGDPGFRYRCNGLEVTSSWEYLFDPHDSNRTYIAYTDIGFARSVDRGATWIPATRGSPWRNTFYRVIADPSAKGRLYAACSNRHDIPHWTHTDSNKGVNAVGGVCVSDDSGASWRVLGKGLPPLPCTSICLDPRSVSGPVTGRVLYCTLYEGGVYRSTDGGKTWIPKSEGLGRPGNLHCYQAFVHPKSGAVYCSITAHRRGNSFPVPGGLWKSDDGGETWKDLTASRPLKWPAGFVVHPEDPDIVYLSAATAPGASEGGVYKTTDGGASWERLMRDQDFAASGGAGYVHCLFLSMHPDDPNRVYAGTAGHGLWMTKDAGATWRRFEALPFAACQNVTIDPMDRKTMYVTTFGGGVWRGPADIDAQPVAAAP